MLTNVNTVKNVHLRVYSDSSDQNLPAALHHMGPRQDHRVDWNPLIHLKKHVLVVFFCKWQFEILEGSRARDR